MIGMNQSGERVEKRGRRRTGRTPRPIKGEFTRLRNDILLSMMSILGLSTADLIMLFSKRLDSCTIRDALREAEHRHERGDKQGPGESIDIDELFNTPLDVDPQGPKYADNPQVREWIERNKSKFSQRKKQR